MLSENEELLDIVDGENHVVGQATREEIHRRKLVHRAVHLLLTDGKGRFLLQKRSARKRDYPEHWDSSVSGHVVAGDDFEATVVKEAAEEIGYVPKEFFPLFLLEPSAENGQEWILFHVEKTKAQRFRADPEEINDLRWWTEENLLKALMESAEKFSPTFKTFFFLWRETGFHLPERGHDQWASVSHGPPEFLQVQRSFLEAAGFPVRLLNDESLGGLGGQGFFSGKNPFYSDLYVPREHLVEAVALLYLSRPEEGESP
ncbi:MAG: NUDIX domain-containing protein [Opitutales bacterium]|nr:NUDIX domain-containing protein [Opitutales bacterium]